MANRTTLPARSEVQEAYTWNLAATYATEEAFEADMKRVSSALEELDSYRGRLGENASTLADFFDLYWETQARLQRLRVYAVLPVSVDQGDQSARAKAGRFQAVALAARSKTAFLEPELLSLGSERLERFVSSEPRLEKLKRYFERLEARRPHVRPIEVEEVLSQATDALGAAGRAYNSLVTGELPFPPAVDAEGAPHEVARSSYSALIGSPDRQLRRSAYDSYTSGFLHHRESLTELYLGRVNESVFLARVRGYASTVEEQLSPQEVPRSVLDNVLAVFTENLPVWHRYFRARKRLLAVEELREYDLFAPLPKRPLKVPYEQAVAWIVEGMEPMGGEFVTHLERGLKEERWVDVYPNRGKRDGAFCAGAYGSQPYIMMSYQNDLTSLSILAHELGHAMHGELTRAAQPVANSGYAMMVAETASNFMQALLRPYLLERLRSEEERLALLEEAFFNFHRYFFIMPTLVRFELAVHEAVERGEGLTSSQLIETMRELFQEGYGDAITADERTGITWATFGHLYLPFYTFQYAAGISAAAALANSVREGFLRGDSGPRERYLKFLSTGYAETPLEQLKGAGVDMTTPAAIEEAFGVLEGYVSELETIVEARG